MSHDQQIKMDLKNYGIAYERKISYGLIERIDPTEIRIIVNSKKNKPMKTKLIAGYGYMASMDDVDIMEKQLSEARELMKDCVIVLGYISDLPSCKILPDNIPNLELLKQDLIKITHEL